MLRPPSLAMPPGRIAGFSQRHPRIELELSLNEAPPSLAGGPFEVRIHVIEHFRQIDYASLDLRPFAA